MNMDSGFVEGGHVAEETRITSPALGSKASSLDSLFPFRSSGQCEDSISSDDDLNSKGKEENYVTAEQDALATLCINTIRFLCVDAINNARSGHPGICMGMAASAFVLFDNHMTYNPSNPGWTNRDRFILSAGHGSMLLYSLFYLYGFDCTSIEDLKRFRQLHSATPGHPECTETAAVEVCTGPLGQGVSNAVGIAISEAHLAAVYNRPGCPVIDNYTFCLVGDGCMMEGLSGEACSLAGHLELGKLIVLYDDNHISIDGSTDLAFTEDVMKRFEAYGWQVLHVEDGNDDIQCIDRAIQKAKACTKKPSLIKITTTIGFGAPNLGGTAKAHGAALGKDETASARNVLNYNYDPFSVPAPVMEHMARKKVSGEKSEENWNAVLAEYGKLYPKLSEQFGSLVIRGEVPEVVEEALQNAGHSRADMSVATRKHSQMMLNIIAPLYSNFLGGSADTTPSTLTDLSCSKDFSASNRIGRNVRFGVREHAMAAVANGIALSGYNLRPFCSTFLVFTDYMKAAMRMASLSKAGTIFVTTHDSIALGEDGPSHQPVEHLASLRAMPQHDVWRPADAVETAAAYAMALHSSNQPSTLVFSRQTVPALEFSNYANAKKGGYVVKWREQCSEKADGLIIATGSEVSLAVEAAQRMLQIHGVFAQVVSLPCWEEFERQDMFYRRSVCSFGRDKTLSVEAASSFGWSRYADRHVGVDSFGLSGPGKEVMSSFGMTVENVVGAFMDMVIMN